MGKVGRQKKYKSIDPFSKHNINSQDSLNNRTGKKKSKPNDIFDLPPKEDNHNQMKSHQRLPDINQYMNKKKKKKTSTKRHKMLPGETRKEFFDRLDNDIGVACQKAMMDTKKMRPKRKERLQNRDRKRKQVKQEKQGIEVSFEFSKTDQPKFGEVAEEPPQLSLPRKGEKKSQTTGLKLAHLLKNEHVLPSLPAKKRRKDMSEVQKQHFDVERESAITKYRQLKKRVASNIDSQKKSNKS